MAISMPYRSMQEKYRPWYVVDFLSSDIAACERSCKIECFYRNNEASWKREKFLYLDNVLLDAEQILMHSTSGCCN